MAAITTEEALRARYGTPSERAVRKELCALDPHCRRFIALSPFVLLSSSGGAGDFADVTPRGDRPGFVAVLDEATLALPDRPGNNRLDTLANVLANPEVGLLFLIPGVDETLRVGGRAEIRDDAALLERFAVDGRAPATVLVVHVRRAFLHCAKALMRARLWDPEARIERASLPTMGRMLKDQIGLSGEPEPHEAMVARYRAELY